MTQTQCTHVRHEDCVASCNCSPRSERMRLTQLLDEARIWLHNARGPTGIVGAVEWMQFRDELIEKEMAKK